MNPSEALSALVERFFPLRDFRGSQWQPILKASGGTTAGKGWTVPARKIYEAYFGLQSTGVFCDMEVDLQVPKNLLASEIVPFAQNSDFAEPVWCPYHTTFGTAMWAWDTIDPVTGVGTYLGFPLDGTNIYSYPPSYIMDAHGYIVSEGMRFISADKGFLVLYRERRDLGSER